MNDATNSNEKKTDTVGSENINEKLSSAAKVIDDARAEARARLAQERKMREAQAKTDRARASELEAKNREDEKRIESVMAKKRAESEYAQSNRRSTEADKRRARAFADTEAAKKEMEKERLLREEAAKREREELLRRNAESDSLLSSVNRRVEESKNAAKARMSEEAELKRILFA